MRRYSLRHGDCLDELKKLLSNSIDSLVTDPPAGIAFMGKDWDKDKGGRDAWVEWMTEVMQECLRVMKPGAHGLVWALPRTSHWTAWALENAGFEVRDCITHINGQGFPKSMDMEKAMDKQKLLCECPVHETPQTGLHCSKCGKVKREKIKGFGTALKPCAEKWWLVRKPLSEKTVAKNVLEHGTGALNIDGCRIETDGKVVWKIGDRPKTVGSIYEYEKPGAGSDSMMKNKGNQQGNPKGRFPSNFICSGEARDVLDEQSGVLKSGNLSPSNNVKETTGWSGGSGADRVKNTFNSNSGGASRFFYCAKASKRERNEGCGGISTKKHETFQGGNKLGRKGKEQTLPQKNNHPTVKPQKLMTYLCRMVTPPGGTVLDPFNGSGSTGVAALSEGFDYIGIEKDPEYLEITRARLEHRLQD